VLVFRRPQASQPFRRPNGPTVNLKTETGADAGAGARTICCRPGPARSKSSSPIGKRLQPCRQGLLGDPAGGCKRLSGTGAMLSLSTEQHGGPGPAFQTRRRRQRPPSEKFWERAGIRAGLACSKSKGDSDGPASTDRSIWCCDGIQNHAFHASARSAAEGLSVPVGRVCCQPKSSNVLFHIRKEAAGGQPPEETTQFRAVDYLSLAIVIRLLSRQIDM